MRKMSTTRLKSARRSLWLFAFVTSLSWLQSISNDCFAQATGPTGDSGNTTAEPVASDSPSEAVPTTAPGISFTLLAGDQEQRIDRLIDNMTMAEKIGQLVQLFPDGDALDDKLAERIRRGQIGSVLNVGNPDIVREAQRIARDDSRLGIPLLVARDVVHGFRTIFPIPLGQAATWNPELVEQAAQVAAREAKLAGIDWTFAPMVDISRDARWGRIAESLGEDPLLSSHLAAAMVEGFQQQRDGNIGGIVACAKHYVGYGLVEGGRDYNRVSVSQADLHNILLPPFRASVDAGCRTLMTSFSEINGIPATAHAPLLRGVLKRDWQFDGIVVSDWGSIGEMVVHGFAQDHVHATELAIMAGVDMDMCSAVFEKHLAKLVADDRVPIERLDDAVRRVLRVKFALAARRTDFSGSTMLAEQSLELSRRVARESVVLLKNSGTLPLDLDNLKRVAVIGPMADAPKQQLGCWVLDAKSEDSITPLADLRERLESRAEVIYAPGAASSWSDDDSLIPAAVKAASEADVAVLFVGEDAVLSGEARSRVSLDLPGVQSQLIRAVVDTGVPTVLVFLAGRPLAIGEDVEAAGAVLFAWHPGTMAGPAITDLLLGEASPSGKLPVTFPRSVGQIPIYYSRSNTGRPSPADYRPLVGSGEDDLPIEFQYKSHYVDGLPDPLFPFGFGLSYTRFDYSSIAADSDKLKVGDNITISANVTNTGDVAAVEVVQLYVQDKVASIVRPVRELKAFRRIRLEPGESQRVSFSLSTADIEFFDNDGNRVLEPGEFNAWIGGDSNAQLLVEFEIVPASVSLAPNTAQQLPAAATSALPAL